MAYEGISREHFVVPMLAGEVVCSSVVPEGFILALRWYPSQTLNDRPDLWDDASTLNSTRNAIEGLRGAGYWLEEFHPGNILVGQEGIKIIDFETAVLNRDNYPADEPEMGTLLAMLNFGVRTNRRAQQTSSDSR